MAPPFRKPMPFVEAMAYLEQKQDKETFLNTKQIAAAWDAEIKRRAFFSARVASADLLAELHKKVNGVMSGAGTQQQARELLGIYLENEGAGALAALGFAPPSLEGGLRELASVRRLDLILYQNTKMAAEVGQYQQWSENWDTHPYGRWHIGYAEQHREEHAARDGLVFRHDHPIWREDPPGGLFNCHCWREELTAAEAEGATVQGADYAFTPSELDFDPGAGLDQPVPVKPTTPPAIAEKVTADLAHPPPKRPPRVFGAVGR